MKEIVVLSGKGGTGKTSIAASIACLAEKCVIADCDVDAADLYLILNPELLEEQVFIGGRTAVVNSDICNGCSLCAQLCRFGAIKEKNGKFEINELACEGCGVCSRFCPEGAISMEDAVSGVSFVSDTRYGRFVYAKLGVSGENSGKLVTQIRNRARKEAEELKADYIITDGSPGIGCPVIASVTGADYVLIVAEPTVSGVHDIERLVKLISHFGIKAGIVVNRFDINTEKTSALERYASGVNLEFLGKIPVDRGFVLSQIQGRSIVEYSLSGTSVLIRALWERIKSCV